MFSGGAAVPPARRAFVASRLSAIVTTLDRRGAGLRSGIGCNSWLRCGRRQFAGSGSRRRTWLAVAAVDSHVFAEGRDLFGELIGRFCG